MDFLVYSERGAQYIIGARLIFVELIVCSEG